MTQKIVLLIEDNALDATLIKEALKDAAIQCTVAVSTTGDNAIELLEQEQPDLVFLDLNLPKVSGIDVLKGLRSHNTALKRTPVVVLTNSISQRDIEACYDHACNAFVRKPIGFDKLCEAVSAAAHFWLNVATPPP